MQLEPFWRERPPPTRDQGSSREQNQETERDEETMQDHKFLDPLVRCARPLSDSKTRRGLRRVDLLPKAGPCEVLGEIQGEVAGVVVGFERRVRGLVWSSRRIGEYHGFLGVSASQ